MRVLVIEDETNLADAIVRGLRRQGMAVDVAYDGTAGHEMAMVTRYDVVVLDRDLPGVHGDVICADLVASGALTRVLMLTASGSVADRVEGLQIGADDYLPKPFAFDELVASRAVYVGSRGLHSRCLTLARPGGGDVACACWWSRTNRTSPTRSCGACAARAWRSTSPTTAPRATRWPW